MRITNRWTERKLFIALATEGMGNKKDMGIKYISKIEQQKLERFFLNGASEVEEVPEYWAHGDDGSLSYCYDCCKKKVKLLRKADPKNKDEYFVDGGWDWENDSIPFCESCGALLSCSLTDYGSEEEVDCLLEHGFNLDEKMDYYSMDMVIGCHGWRPMTEEFYSRNAGKRERDMAFYEKLHKLCKRILIKIDLALQPMAKTALIIGTIKMPKKGSST